jgi:DNA polymerase III, delta subunit
MTTMNQSIFENVIGHDSQKIDFANLIQKNLVPHAMIFSGTTAVGKRKFAQALAIALLSGDSSEKIAETSKLILSGNHPDYFIVKKEDEKRDLSVDAARELCSKLRLKPYFGNGVIATIDNAHEMSTACANSLLKTLEEPTPGSYLILITNSPQRLLPTISSRCQTINFGELLPEQCKTILDKIIATTLEDADLIKDLYPLATSSLESLELDTLVDPLTLKITSPKLVREHLEKIIFKHQTLQRIFPTLSTTSSLTLAAELASEKESLNQNWREIKFFIDKNIKHASSCHASGRWGELMLKTIEAERLCLERNLSPQLQLSKVLVELAERLL